MSLKSGDRLGTYEILALLGAGGMGEVYRARDLRLGREVALKLVRADIAHHPGQSLRFEREARLLASLNHPNIAILHGLETHDGVAFLVMELVVGETLAEQLTHGPLAIDEAVAVGRQIALALEAAHEKGIIHRDLKPANIKRTPSGQVKLLDFGLARALAVETPPGEAPIPTVGPDPTSSGVVVGTPRYMSPEQARALPLDPRTDIWSFGCVLYELLTGRPLFDGPSTADVLAAVLERAIDWRTLPEHTPPPIRALLRRCLERDRERRLAAIVDARRALEPTTEPRPTTEDETPLPPFALPADQPTERAPVNSRSNRRARRWPWLLVIGLFLSLSCCVGSSWCSYRFLANLSLPWRPAPNSVAVLPLDTGNPFRDGSRDRFADGLAADMTAHLADSPYLRVTPHAYAAEYARTSPRMAASFLHVRWVVVGKVEAASAEELRISIELVDAGNDAVRWRTSRTIALAGADPSAPQELRGQLAAELARDVKTQLLMAR